MDENGVYQMPGSLINKYREEINRLGNITGTGGISVTRSAMGITISGKQSSTQIKFALFSTTEDAPTYPSDDDSDCIIFPAVIYSPVEFDPDDCTNTLDQGVGGEEIYVYNLEETYIPENTYSEIFKLNGLWFCRWYRPFIWGELDEDLNNGSSAVLSVWDHSGFSGGVTSENITIYDKFLPSGKIDEGTRVGANWCRLSKKYICTATQCSS